MRVRVREKEKERATQREKDELREKARDYYMEVSKR